MAQPYKLLANSTAILGEHPDPSAADALRICVDFVLKHVPPQPK